MANLPRELRHGMSHTPEWEAWRAMLKRCYKPNAHNFGRYGGRGIAVCDRWRESFANFFADMGLRPSPRHSLHRKDNDGNYEPANCVWALPKVQASNRSRPRRNLVRSVRPKHTGQHPVNFNDLAGQTFGRWTVIRYHGRIATRSGGSVWWCRCECGTERPVQGRSLVGGDSVSCGCLQKEVAAEIGRTTLKRANTTHGLSRTREYASWNQMLQRCLNPKNPTYERYGAKGVTVCDRWQGPDGFKNFLADLGPCPPGHTIDRTDPARGYEPENCRWLHRSLQSANRKYVRRFPYGDEMLTIPELASRTGIGRPTLYARLALLGWTVERATTQDPSDYHKGRGA